MQVRFYRLFENQNPNRLADFPRATTPEEGKMSIYKPAMKLATIIFYGAERMSTPSTPAILPRDGGDFELADRAAEALANGWGRHISPDNLVMVVGDGGFWGLVPPQEIFVFLGEEAERGFNSGEYYRRAELWLGTPGEIKDQVSYSGDLEREKAEFYELREFLQGGGELYDFPKKKPFLSSSKEEQIERIKEARWKDLGTLIVFQGELAEAAWAEWERRDNAGMQPPPRYVYNEKLGVVVEAK